MQLAALRDMLCCMRTTVDLPDELLRSARQRAAQEDTTLTRLLADGLRLRLADAPKRPGRKRRLPVSKAGGGLQPGIDPASNSSLYDAADDERATA